MIHLKVRCVCPSLHPTPHPFLIPLSFSACFSSAKCAQMNIFPQHVVLIYTITFTKPICVALPSPPCLTHPFLSVSLSLSLRPLMWPFPSPPILAFISQMTGWLTVIQQMLGRGGLTNCFNSNQLLLLSGGTPHNPLPA